MEDYLKDIHAESYMGTGDDMPDAFENWISELSGEELVEYADKFVEWTKANIRRALDLEISKEINIAHSENQPTSRLTSLFNKLSDIFK